MIWKFIVKAIILLVINYYLVKTNLGKQYEQ